MIARTFHNWERRLASVDTNRVVRPFEWGLEWLPTEAGGQVDGWAGESPNGSGHVDDGARVERWVEAIMRDTHAFFTPPPTTAYEFTASGVDGEGMLRFPSALSA